jgi:hypothetical protein
MGSMRTPGRRLLPVAIAFVLAVAAWLGVFRFSTHTVIEGFPLGAPAACSDSCQRFSEAAAAWLDRVAPGHALVSRIELFEPDYRDANGNLLLTTRSGGRDYIAVIHLADGSARAIEVGCGMGIHPEMCFEKQPMTPAG